MAFRDGIFFSSSFPSNFEIAAGWRPSEAELLGLHDLFNRWLLAAEHALQEFVVVGSGDSRKPMGSYLPPPNFTPKRTMATSGRKMRFALLPQAGCLIA